MAGIDVHMRVDTDDASLGCWDPDVRPAGAVRGSNHRRSSCALQQVHFSLIDTIDHLLECGTTPITMPGVTDVPVRSETGRPTNWSLPAQWLCESSGSSHWVTCIALQVVSLRSPSNFSLHLLSQYRFLGVRPRIVPVLVLPRYGAVTLRPTSWDMNADTEGSLPRGRQAAFFATGVFGVLGEVEFAIIFCRGGEGGGVVCRSA